MRKLSLLLLLTAAVGSVSAGAQDAPAPSTDGQASSTVEPPADKKADAKNPAQSNPRLAPGGVTETDDKFPLHVNATFDNYVGNGFLAATEYQRQPLWGSSLALRPSASLPKIDPIPKMTLSGSIDFSVNNWLPSYSNSGVYDRVVRVSDFGLSLGMRELVKDELTNITISPSISARVPLSIASRQSNLATSVGASAQVAWNSPETPVGTFTVTYAPSLRGNLFTEVASTVSCEAGVQQAGVTTNPLDEGRLPLYYAREAQLTESGECIMPGRQTLGSIGQGTSFTWSLTDHSVSLALGYSLGIQRPLSSRPDLTGRYASDQNFGEKTTGSLSYTYTVPVDFPLSLTAGISSDQPAWNAAGTMLRFPLYDFVTPANNFTAGFFDISVGI